MSLRMLGVIVKAYMCELQLQDHIFVDIDKIILCFCSTFFFYFKFLLELKQITWQKPKQATCPTYMAKTKQAHMAKL